MVYHLKYSDILLLLSLSLLSLASLQLVPYSQDGPPSPRRKGGPVHLWIRRRRRVHGKDLSKPLAGHRRIAQWQ